MGRRFHLRDPDIFHSERVRRWFGHTTSEAGRSDRPRLDSEPFPERARGWLLRNGIVVALVAEFVFFSTQSTEFLTGSNIRLVLLQNAVVMIIAVPSALLLMTGYIDFAVGSTLGLSGIILGQQLHDHNVVVASLIALALGALIGTTQGILATWFDFSPIVVTLGYFTAVRGLAFVVSGGLETSSFGSSFDQIGQSVVQPFSIPTPLLIALVVLLVGILVHQKTRFGRHLVAIGVNPEAAYRAGIPIRRIPLLLYIATSTAAGLGALISVARLDSAPPTLGTGLELQVLSSVLLGGVSFSGGRGTLTGMAAGVLFIGVLNNGLLLLGVQPFWFTVSSGAALVAAAALDKISRRLAKLRRVHAMARGEQEVSASARTTE